jgi:cob(I)alamin adenosyltransferase
MTRRENGMVTLNRIYTRAGDGGRTQLVGGERRPKHDLRIEAYGTVDETNAAVGLTRLHTAADPDADAILARVQNDLFDLGADLATPEVEAKGRRDLRVTDAQVERLEHEIDALNAALPELRSFVLPGGTPAAAHLHLARTVCRRAERLVVALADKDGETVSATAIKYLNRLSDHLFVVSRHLNAPGDADVLWVPGQNR